MIPDRYKPLAWALQPVLFSLVALVIACVIGLIAFSGCAEFKSKIKAGVVSVDRNRIQAVVDTAVGAAIEHVEASLAKVEGDVRLGGQNDNLTSWIYALGFVMTVLVSGPAGGAFYQFVMRPHRLGREAIKKNGAKA